MIYFIQPFDGGSIKIGTTIRLSQRLRQLEKEYGRSFCVLAVTDGGYPEEQLLHQRFAKLWKEGEWFEPDTELIVFVETECRPWDGSDEVPPSKPTSLLLLKGSPEYREWLSRFGDFSRMPTAVLVDRALTKLAKEEGFEPPPKR